jgi:hypothetical protein
MRGSNADEDYAVFCRIQKSLWRNLRPNMTKLEQHEALLRIWRDKRGSRELRSMLAAERHGMQLDLPSRAYGSEMRGAGAGRDVCTRCEAGHGVQALLLQQKEAAERSLRELRVELSEARRALERPDKRQRLAAAGEPAPVVAPRTARAVHIAVEAEEEAGVPMRVPADILFYEKCVVAEDLPRAWATDAQQHLYYQRSWEQAQAAVPGEVDLNMQRVELFLLQARRRSRALALSALDARIISASRRIATAAAQQPGPPPDRPSISDANLRLAVHKVVSEADPNQPIEVRSPPF